MSILLHGLQAFALYKWSVTIFTVSALGLGGWAGKALSVNDRKNAYTQLALALGLGSLILIGLSFIVILLGRLWSPALKPASILIVFLGLAALADWIRRDRL